MARASNKVRPSRSARTVSAPEPDKLTRPATRKGPARIEAKRPEAQRTEAPRKEAPRKEAPKKEAPRKEPPRKEPLERRASAAAKTVRVKIVWEVCSGAGKTVQTFPYPEKAAAEARMRALARSSGRSHMLRATKVPME